MKTEAHWKRVGMRPHHGICLPLSALKTDKSCGIGEFLDLLPLITWCRSLGLDCLQLLPLNDSGFDPSPYNPLSSCALDPVYLSLHELAKDDPLEAFLPYKDLPRLNRDAVKRLKYEWLLAFFKKSFPSLSSTSAYRTFVSQNPWLADYCRFLSFKEAFEWKHWKDWPQNPKEDRTVLDFHSFLQYLCFSQLEKVRSFASENSFFLIGDMPHLISSDSADVWTHRPLFCLDLEAGAPPDKYNPLGQNWGFPLFHWEEMEKEHYTWWKQRFSVMTRLYHIYRIDHVVGFFRIWTIPHGNLPSEGSFIPSDPALWLQHGQKILEMMIDVSPLLPIAEDLGIIPSEVYPILKKLGICGTKVLRWEAAIPYQCYEPFSMTTVSTPDISLVPVWWQTNPEEEAANFARLKGWHYEPPLSPEHQIEILRDAHHTSSYFHVNLLQEYLYPFPELHSPHLEDERINLPGTLLPTNWTYRFLPSLKTLIAHPSLNRAFRDILK